MKKYFITIILLIFTVGCSISGPIFFLDNPTDTTIQVEIDKIKYVIEPNKFEKLKLKAGAHNMKLSNGKEVNFIVYSDSKGGIINPTQSDYILVHIAYAVKGQEKSFRPMGENVIIDGVEYDGPFGIANDLIIDKNTKQWKYNIHTPFPDKETTSDTNTKGNIRTNIFTKNEFINFFEAETGTQGYHEANKVLSEKPVLEKKKEVVISEVPNFKSPEVKKYAEEIITLDKEYGVTENPGRQRKIRSEFKKAWKNYVEALMKSDSSDLDLSNKFATSNLGRGVIVKPIN